MSELTDEQILALLSSTNRNINIYGNYNPPAYDPPEQTGPVRFCNSAVGLRCGYITDAPEWSPDGKPGMCGSPAYIRFKGTPMCTVHIIRSCNTLLVEMGVME